MKEKNKILKKYTEKIYFAFPAQFSHNAFVTHIEDIFSSFQHSHIDDGSNNFPSECEHLQL